jgi:ABC-type phosphate/phosphonate transport system substrate-binding protein
MGREACLAIGAVAYTANVVPIWEGIRAHFDDAPVGMDVVLYSNYERQVDALLAGHIDIAWNTNLAWVRTVGRTDGHCRALAMRDTDLAFSTVFVSRTGAGLAGPKDLKGRRLALGSRDSAQARILPLYFLAREGVVPPDLELVCFDADVGKHGDTGRSELDAVRAVLDDQADAAALGVATWEALGRGELAPGALEAFWETPPYCHCNFSALDGLDHECAEAWVTHLLEMDWDDPGHRRILEMEGLRRWVRPEIEGYRPLFEAVAEQRVPLLW